MTNSEYNLSENKGIKRWGSLIFWGIAICVGWLVVQMYVGKGSGGSVAMPGWTEDWVAAEKESLKTGKPRLVMFTADWCGYCTQMKEEVLLKPEVAKILEDKFVRVKVDCTKETPAVVQLNRKMDVSGYPTLVVLDEKGEVKAKVAGAMGKDDFLRWVGQVGGGGV